MSQKSKFDLHPHLMTVLKEQMRKDINVPTEKLFWLDEFQKHNVSKQAITAKKRAFLQNPGLLNTDDPIPAEQKARKRKYLFNQKKKLKIFIFKNMMPLTR